jgi:hypothetical protein
MVCPSSVKILTLVTEVKTMQNLLWTNLESLGKGFFLVINLLDFHILTKEADLNTFHWIIDVHTDQVSKIMSKCSNLKQKLAFITHLRNQ